MCVHTTVKTLIYCKWQHPALLKWEQFNILHFTMLHGSDSLIAIEKLKKIF